jgi:hypothetical protein
MRWRWPAVHASSLRRADRIASPTRPALARCLVTTPSLVLLDEPLANLDVRLRGHGGRAREPPPAHQHDHGAHHPRPDRGHVAAGDTVRLDILGGWLLA